MPDIKEILKAAKAAGASDVHLTVGAAPRMRVHGTLFTMDYPKMLPSDTLEILLEIMSESQRNAFEESGEYDMSFSILETGRYRVNAYRQRGSVGLAFRLVGTKIPAPEELEIPEGVIHLYGKKRGLVLVTGPAGSGKSTTLAAIIDRINNHREAHIITLEDPIEFLHQHKKSIVNQREIGLDSQNYSKALKAALREDPDVILVGELRDMETVSLAVMAAESGCLVLSSLYTQDAVGAIERMTDMFLPHQQTRFRLQLSNVMEAVVSQQLIPSADGQGRVAAFEVLHTNSGVRNLIREGKYNDLYSVMAAGQEEGMVTMEEAIHNLYQERRISQEMAVQFARDSEKMKEKISPEF